MSNQDFTPVQFPTRKIFKKESYEFVEYQDEFQNVISHDVADLEDFLHDKLTHVRDMGDIAMNSDSDINPNLLLFFLNHIERDLKNFFYFLDKQAVIRLDTIRDEIIGVNVKLKDRIDRPFEADKVISEKEYDFVKKARRMESHWCQGFIGFISVIEGYFETAGRAKGADKDFNQMIDNFAERLKKEYQDVPMIKK